MIIGAKVKDRNGEVIGQIDYLIRDTWSGEIKKYMVRREAPNKDIFFSPDDAFEASESQVKLKKTVEELAKED
jgi:hypothetical protein